MSFNHGFQVNFDILLFLQYLCVNLFLYFRTMIKYFCASSISISLTLIWLRYVKARNNKGLKILFYNPLDDRKCQCQQFFDSQCLVGVCSSNKTREIVNCLQNARKSIDICVFAISNKPISDAIIDAYTRGIPIRIIISNCILSKSKEVDHFKSVGIVVKYQKDSKYSYMHNKYSVVDSTWLIQGSMNWTHHATFENWENVIITDIQSLVKVFATDFEKTWTII